MLSTNPRGLEASGAPGQGGPSLGLELERRDGGDAAGGGPDWSSASDIPVRQLPAASRSLSAIICKMGRVIPSPELL